MSAAAPLVTGADSCCRELSRSASAPEHSTPRVRIPNAFEPRFPRRSTIGAVFAFRLAREMTGRLDGRLQHQGFAPCSLARISSLLRRSLTQSDASATCRCGPSENGIHYARLCSKSTSPVVLNDSVQRFQYTLSLHASLSENQASAFRAGGPLCGGRRVACAARLLQIHGH